MSDQHHHQTLRAISRRLAAELENKLTRPSPPSPQAWYVPPTGALCPHCREDEVVADGLAHGMCQLCWAIYAQDTYQEYLGDEQHPDKLAFVDYLQKLGAKDGVAWLNHRNEKTDSK